MRRLAALHPPPAAPAGSRACGLCGVVGGKEEEEAWEGRRVVLLKCAKCKDVVYCGVECQRAAWHTHKGLCKKAV